LCFAVAVIGIVGKASVAAAGPAAGTFRKKANIGKPPDWFKGAHTGTADHMDNAEKKWCLGDVIRVKPVGFAPLAASTRTTASTHQTYRTAGVSCMLGGIV
jgi:hypothetical protein